MTNCCVYNVSNKFACAFVISANKPHAPLRHFVHKLRRHACFYKARADCVRYVNRRVASTDGTDAPVYVVAVCPGQNLNAHNVLPLFGSNNASGTQGR